MKLFSGILLLMLVFVKSFSQTAVSFAIQKSSFLTIHGTSNLLSFDLLLKGEHIPGNLFSLTTTRNQNRINISQNNLSIEVKNFTSGNKMALRDFLKLIKSDIYPKMHVQLNSLELQPDNEKTEFSDIDVSANSYGSITIAGVKRQYCIPLTWCRDGDTYYADGNLRLSIRDFGLEPPVTLMGIIKVSEWIDIRFHLICKKAATIQ